MTSPSQSREKGEVGYPFTDCQVRTPSTTLYVPPSGQLKICSRAWEDDCETAENPLTNKEMRRSLSWNSVNRFFRIRLRYNPEYSMGSGKDQSFPDAVAKLSYQN